MLYSLLGRIVWNGGKLVLRRKYGPTYLPKPLVAGGIVVAALGVGLVASRRGSSS